MQYSVFFNIDIMTEINKHMPEHEQLTRRRLFNASSNLYMCFANHTWFANVPKYVDIRYLTHCSPLDLGNAVPIIEFSEYAFERLLPTVDRTKLESVLCGMRLFTDRELAATIVLRPDLLWIVRSHALYTHLPSQYISKTNQYLALVCATAGCHKIYFELGLQFNYFNILYALARVNVLAKKFIVHYKNSVQRCTRATFPMPISPVLQQIVARNHSVCTSLLANKIVNQQRLLGHERDILVAAGIVIPETVQVSEYYPMQRVSHMPAQYIADNDPRSQKWNLSAEEYNCTNFPVKVPHVIAPGPLDEKQIPDSDLAFVLENACSQAESCVDCKECQTVVSLPYETLSYYGSNIHRLPRGFVLAHYIKFDYISLVNMTISSIANRRFDITREIIVAFKTMRGRFNVNSIIQDVIVAQETHDSPDKLAMVVELVNNAASDKLAIKMCPSLHTARLCAAIPSLVQDVKKITGGTSVYAIMTGQI